MAEKIGLLAGSGWLPAAIVEKHKSHIEVITFKGQPKPLCELDDVPHHEIALGAVNKVLDVLRASGCKKIVFAGGMAKPSFFDIKPDWRGIKFLSSLKSYHDNALLEGLVKLLESEGFEVVGAHELLPGLCAGKGLITGKAPVDELMSDIELGQQVLKNLGELDIGQAAIVHKKVVLGVEAVEGTSALIERCAGLRGKANKGGVLIKAAKPQQDLRVDMPAIGLETIELLARYNYAGVAIQAGKTLLLNSEDVTSCLKRNKLFLYGF